MRVFGSAAAWMRAARLGRIPNNDVRLEGVAGVLISDDHESRMDTDAHVNLHACLAQESFANGSHGLYDTKPGLNRAPGIILMSGGISEVG